MGKEEDLCTAAEDGDVPAILKSLNEGANINCNNSFGFTPLTKAVYNGKGAAVTTLVEQGASLDLKNNLGGTALYYASVKNYPSIVKYLVAMGAKLGIDFSERGSRFGRTVLNEATSRGHAEVVAILKNPEKAKKEYKECLANQAAGHGLKTNVEVERLVNKAAGHGLKTNAEVEKEVRAQAENPLAGWTLGFSEKDCKVFYSRANPKASVWTHAEMKEIVRKEAEAEAARHTAQLEARVAVARKLKAEKAKQDALEKESKRKLKAEKAKQDALEAELARDDSSATTKHNPLYDSDSGGEDDARAGQPPARQPSRGVPQDPKVDALFDLMDTNSNGIVSKIEFVEFIRAHKPSTGRYSSTAKLQTMFGLERAHGVNRDDFQRVFATYQEDGLQVSLFNVSLGNDTDDDEDGLFDGFSKEEMQEQRDIEYADAIEAANGVVQAAMVEYRSVYTRHLTEAGNIDRRDQFEVVATAIKARCTGPIDGLKVVLLQPDCGVPKSKRALFMMTLRQRFKNHMKRSDSVLMSIRAKVNADYKTGEVKGTERWIEKARIAYGNELRRVTDVERRSVVCVNFDDMLLALKLIDEEFIIIRIKNRFELENAAAKDTAAYRDCQLLCYAKDTKLIFEIQLHLECIFQLKSEIALKKGADGRSGHDKYIEFRLLKEIADAEHRRV